MTRAAPSPELVLLCEEEWEDLSRLLAERDAAPLMSREAADAFLARTVTGSRWVTDIARSRTAAARRAGTGEPAASPIPPGDAASIDQAA